MIIKIKIKCDVPPIELDIKNNKEKSFSKSQFTIDLTKCKSVRDEIRGYIIFNGKKWDFVNRYTYESYIIKNNKKKKTIVLVLESPHKDEYDTNYNPIRPANGATGASIEAYICKYHKHWKLNKNTDYKVCLVNAVQIQASCYHELQKQGLKLEKNDLKEIKNNVLNKEFDKKDLERRINNQNPDIVINCCTAFIYKSVQETIDNLNTNGAKNLTTYKCYHPSSTLWRKIKLKPA